MLNRQEIKRLLETAGSRLRPVLIVLLNTGMRKGEALGLRWDDVDFHRGYINVQKSKSGKPRSIPMSSLIYQMLREMRETSQSEFVFINSRTGSSLMDIKTAFKTACDKAKIKGVTAHSLRHTAATMMIEAGTDVVTVARILGHSKIEMTARYCHPSAQTMRLAVEVLAENLKKESQKTDTVEIKAPLIHPGFN